MTDTNKALEAFQRIESSLRSHIQNEYSKTCLYEDDLNLVRAALAPDTVVIPREGFKNIVSRFKFCLADLWDEYKRSYSRNQFEDYFKEEIEALAILSQYGEQK